jgi:hypothetical protein
LHLVTLLSKTLKRRFRKKGLSNVRKNITF